MARYLGPKCKLSRREGTDLFLKSARRSLDDKCKLDSQARPARRASRPRTSDYGTAAAREAEAHAACTACSSASSARYFDEADRRKGTTGENLLQLLESPPGQRRLPHGLRLHARRGAPARVAQGDHGQRQAGEHPVVPGQGRRRGRGAREGARSSCASRRRCKLRRAGRLPDWVEVDAKKLKGVVQGAARPRRVRRRHQRSAGRRAVLEVTGSSADAAACVPAVTHLGTRYHPNATATCNECPEAPHHRRAEPSSPDHAQGDAWSRSSAATATRWATRCAACCCRRCPAMRRPKSRSPACCTSTRRIDGVQEDVVDILLNLKGVVFKLHNRDEVDADAAQGRRRRRSPPPTSSRRTTSRSSIPTT